jgi:hypothetical protein
MFTPLLVNFVLWANNKQPENLDIKNLCRRLFTPCKSCTWKWCNCFSRNVRQMQYVRGPFHCDPRISSRWLCMYKYPALPPHSEHCVCCSQIELLVPMHSSPSDRSKLSHSHSLGCSRPYYRRSYSLETVLAFAQKCMSLCSSLLNSLLSLLCHGDNATHKGMQCDVVKVMNWYMWPLKTYSRLSKTNLKVEAASNHIPIPYKP